MNKISKKILAIVTMVAFVVTMMPFAAFAADPEPADVQTSEFHVVVNDKVDDDVTIDADDTATAQFYVNDGSGVGTTAALSAADASKIKIWAVDNKTNQVTTALKVDSVKGDGVNTATFERCDANTKVWKAASAVTNGTQVELSFTRSGEYTIYAGVGDFDSNNGVSTIDKLLGESVVTVEGTTAEVAQIVVADKAYTDDKATDTINVDSMLANGIDTYTVKAYAQTEEGKAVKGATFTLDTNKNGIDLEETEVTTDNTGMFEITFSMTKADAYKIYVNGDISITVNVAKNADKAIDTITNTTEDAKTLLAGTDKNFAEAAEVSLADAVQFTLAYDNGVELSNTEADQTVIDAEPAADLTDATKHSKYLSIEQKPEKSKLTAGDLKLAWSAAKDAYTLVYVGNTDADKDLLAGEYTVKVALTSGKSAEATFTLAEFGEIEDLAVKVQAKAYRADQKDYANIDDEIVYGQDMKVIPMYVDANGIEIPAKDAQVGVVGDVTSYGTQYPDQFRVNDDKDLVGSIITVRVFDDNAKKYVEKELTIVDQYDAYTLAFDNEQGEANKNNKVEVSVVDEDGTVIKNVNGADVMAYVADQSNEDAKVEVTADEKTVNGKADITIFSNEETTVDVVVAVKTAADEIYGATLSYTIGAADVDADTSVVMTIGSSDIVVNNNVVNGDAAPYVDSNWRTMVPLRALTESFGGTAEWDGDARTVTIVNGDTTIVFNADSNKYTVNDVEKEMDTELSIIDGRTYVPVKFVAEELGYTVTALKDAAGLTASVVIQK